MSPRRQPAGAGLPGVRSAWITYDGGWYSEFYIGGPFAGEAHTFHNGTLSEADEVTGIALNDYGEIWMVRPSHDQLWKWPGGRLHCRADRSQVMNGAFYGEYIAVSVYGATDT